MKYKHAHTAPFARACFSHHHCRTVPNLEIHRDFLDYEILRSACIAHFQRRQLVRRRVHVICIYIKRYLCVSIGPLPDQQHTPNNSKANKYKHPIIFNTHTTYKHIHTHIHTHIHKHAHTYHYHHHGEHCGAHHGRSTWAL